MIQGRYEPRTENEKYLMIGVQYDKKSTEIIEYQRTIAHIHCITKQL